LSTLLLLAVSSVFAQEKQVLGLCAMYNLAFPSGHTVADLDSVFWDHLPSTYAEFIVQQEMPNLSTSDFVEMYEVQREFCEEQEAETTNVLLEAQSEGEMSTEGVETLHMISFESSALLSQAQSQLVATTDRRELMTFAAAFLATAIFGSYAIYIAYAALAILAAVAIGAVIYGVIGLYMAYGPSRRQLSSGSRLLTSAQGVARRAVTAMETVEIPLMEVISACNHNVPSFVCSLSTVALTHVVTSQFCGGANLDSCNTNLQYAIGYAKAMVDANIDG